MKQICKIILFALLMSIAGAKVFAYDFAIDNSDGITIYYNYINDGKDLEVTYNTHKEWKAYSGVVVIPEEVTYMNRTRKVTSIGGSAFWGDSGLTSITIPNSVTSIGSSAFDNCSGLTSITIPNSVTSIGDGAFYECSGLTSITITNSVTYIGDDAFSRCSGLTSITIPNSVTSIGGSAFNCCKSLTSITIPNSVTSIGEYAFSYCTGLASITIPNSVTSIGNLAFYNCTHLTSVTIGNSVTSIGKHAFDGADIPIVVSLVENPIEIIGKTSDERTFSQNTFNNASLYVPVGTIEKYKATEGWKDFLFIEEGISAKYTLTYMVDGEVYKTYELIEGERITPEAEPTKDGYEFSGWSTIPETMPAEDLTITGSFINLTDLEQIKITSAGQTTWCSAYDLDFTDVEGLRAYTAEGYDREMGTIWLMRVKKVPAGEGILLIGDEGDYKVPHKSTTSYYGNFMVGTLEPKTINETDGEYTNYYLSSGTYGMGFYKVNGSVDLKANRAYLPLLKSTVSGSRGFIGIDFDDGEDGTTGISEAQQRVGEQDVWYNLQGQRVDNPSKGLYIRNGKKVIVK